ncbi:MAG: hypothetical protein IPO29_19895 [Anaerolineae bacterium]|nr:hypothetical protein [Anaerolineae bacterium]
MMCSSIFLAAVLDVLNLEVGWVYLRDPDRNQFHLASWRNVAPDLGARLIHAPGLGAEPMPAHAAQR